MANDKRCKMAVLFERLARNGSVQLEGYGHQVGGQYLLMKFGDTVCKPLIRREDQFYDSLTAELKSFTANYYGVIGVSFERQPSGEIKAIAYPREHNTARGTLDINTMKVASGQSLPSTGNVDGGDAYVSPWSAECTKNSTMKLQALGDELDTIRQDYIVLENLSSSFHAPSILDLKVGCCDHKDFESERKRLKHQVTMETSTTRTLRVRMAGMQRYDAAKNEYIFRDKYYGRSLSEDGFHEELKSFLHNGLRFRSDLLPNIIHMLEELQRVIERQDSFRFFSSSLLIIYDGAECAGVNGVRVRGGQSGRVRVDTEDTRTNGIATPPLSNHTHSPNREHVNCPLDSREQTHTEPTAVDNVTFDPAQTLPNDHSSLNGETSIRSSLGEMRTKVDVRMIDFARATCDLMNEVKVPGCDKEYMVGLKSLTASFRGM